MVQYVPRAVASDSRCPRFEISHWQKKYIERLLSTTLTKTKLRKMRPGMAHKKLFKLLKVKFRLSVLVEENDATANQNAGNFLYRLVP